MKAVRITAALKQHGDVQYFTGRVVRLSDDLADTFVKEGDAEHVPQAEYARLQRRSETAAMVPPPPKRGRR